MPATTKSPAPWFLLFSRLLLFAGVQALVALAFLLAGSNSAWGDSAKWWPFIVTITNLICLVILTRQFRLEGKRYWDLFRFDRQHIWGDLLALLVVTILSAPLAMLPSTLIGGWLFGDPNATLAFLVHPLPKWAVYLAIVVFPVSQGLVELATYFRFVMPSLPTSGMRPWLALVLPALLLGFQHLAAPLIFDFKYLAWRGLMFVPFAFLAAIALRWRPRLLPYMAIVHVLMNVSFATMFLSAAY
ncbi:MAG: hypothetical protein ACYCZF_03440 [Anaerolineae bacterium]